MPRKVFVAGEILTAADVNTNLMDQSVMVFDDSTARGSAIPSPSEGMVTYLKDTNLVEAYTGAAFTPVGKILQVVSAVKTDTFTSTSTSFTGITGLTATITPTSSSSKILIFAQVSYGGTNNAAPGIFRFSGGNTSGFVGDAASNRTRAIFGGFNNADNSSNMFVANMTFLDSPATTSATTYGVEVMRGSAGTGSININRSQLDSDNNAHVRGASSITVMEVAG